MGKKGSNTALASIALARGRATCLWHSIPLLGQSPKFTKAASHTLKGTSGWHGKLRRLRGGLAKVAIIKRRHVCMYVQRKSLRKPPAKPENTYPHPRNPTTPFPFPLKFLNLLYCSVPNHKCPCRVIFGRHCSTAQARHLPNWEYNLTNWVVLGLA